MNHRRWLVVAVFTAAIRPGSTLAEEPVPIRRQIVPAERLTAELARPGAASFIRLSRADFEERVRRAAARVAALETPPRLLAIRATARFEGTDLIGTAEWAIRHDHEHPGLMPFGVPAFAVRAMSWAAGSAALVGELDPVPGGPGLSLLVEKRGDHFAHLEWSARGRPTPGGWRFDLTGPVCAVASLELDLPIGFQPVVDGTAAAVSGPRSAGTGRSVWTIAHGGQARFELLVRSPADEAATVFVSQRARYDWRHHHADASLELDVDATRDGVTELTVAHDSGLKVWQVRSADLSRWQSFGNDVDGRPRLRLHFARPVRKQTVSIDALTHARANLPWSCPAVLVEGAVSRGETLTIGAPAGIALDDFRPGGLRLRDARTGPDGAQALALESTWAGTHDRPSVRIRRTAVELDVMGLLSWHVGLDRQTLDAELTVRPRRGPLGHDSLTVPAGWDVEKVMIRGADCAWSVGPSANGRTALDVEFSPPLAPGVDHVLSVKCRGQPPSGGGQPLPFPEVAVSRPRTSVVTLDVRISPMLDVTARPGPSAATADVPASPGTPPDFRYLFRGALVAGELAVTARPSRLTVTGSGLARIEGDRVTYGYRLTLNPEAGAAAAVLLRSTGVGPKQLSWRSAGTVRVRGVYRLDSLKAVAALGGAFAASGVAAAAPDEDLWLVAFDRPAVAPVTLDVGAEMQAGPSPAQRIATGLGLIAATTPWCAAIGIAVPKPVRAAGIAVPLWSVVGTDFQSHEMTVSDPAYCASITAEGVRDLPAREGANRSFGHSALPGRLVVLPGSDLKPVPRLAAPRMTVGMAADGRLICAYQVRLLHWSQPEVAIRLPAGAEWLSAHVAGRAASVGPGDVPTVCVPPDGDVVIDVAYALSGAGVAPWSRLDASAPTLPAPGGEPRRVWRLPAGLASWGGEPLLGGYRPDAGPVPQVPTLLPEGEVATNGSTLWVARPAAVWIWAALSSGLIAAALLQLNRRWVGYATLGLPAVILVAWPWVPEPLRPLALGPAIIPIVICLGWKLGAERAQSRAAVAVGLLIAIPVPASAPEPVTVFIIPGEQEGALAPATLLERLDALSRRGGPTAGAVILSGAIVGSVVDDAARLEARWRVHAFSPGAVIDLPVADIRPTEFALDGEAAYPRTVGKSAAITIPKAGPAELTVRFTVPVTDGAMRFRIPEAMSTRLDVRLPAKSKLIFANGTGAQQQSVGRLEADCGRVREVDLRWTATDAPRRDALRCHEAYLWDLDGPAARLWAMIKCLPDGDLPRTAVLSLPAELDVVGVRAAEPARLTTWSVVETARGRTLSAELLATDSPSILVIALAPRGPLSPNAALPMPTALGATESFVAWRGSPMVAAPGRVTGAVEASADAFVADYQSPAGLPASGSALHVYQRRVGSPAPQIRATAVPTSSWRGTCDIAWRLADSRAEVVVVADLTAEQGSQALVEWDVTAQVRVTGVEGPEVAAWSRSGNRVQVWLDRPATKAQIRWHGSVARLDAAARFDVPPVRLLGGATTTLRVAERPGWDLKVAEAVNLMATAGRSAGRRITFQAERPNYRLSVTPQSVVAAAAYELKTTVSAVDGRAQAVTVLTTRGRNGATANFGLHVGSSTNDSVAVEATGAEISDWSSTAGGREWVVDPTPGATEVRVTVTMQASAANANWTVPVVSVAAGGATRLPVENAITVHPGLVARPAGAVRLGTGDIWLAGGDGWRLEVGPEPPVGPPRRQIPFVELTLSRESGVRWWQQAEFWVDPARPGDVEAIWPTPVQIEDAQADGRPMPTRPEPVASVVIPLTGPPRPRRIRLAWTLPDVPDQPPQLIRPELRLDGQPFAPGEILWSVAPGVGHWKPTDPLAQALGAAGADVRRAAAYLGIAGLPHSTHPESVAAVDAIAHQAARALRRAELNLAAEADPGALADRVQWLRSALPATAQAAPTDDPALEVPTAVWASRASSLTLRRAGPPTWAWPLAQSSLVFLIAVAAARLARRGGYGPEIAGLAAVAWAVAGVPGPWWVLAAGAVVSRFVISLGGAPRFFWQSQPATSA